jgi:hypothetical protein
VNFLVQALLIYCAEKWRDTNDVRFAVKLGSAHLAAKST